MGRKEKGKRLSFAWIITITRTRTEQEQSKKNTTIKQKNQMINYPWLVWKKISL